MCFQHLGRVREWFEPEAHPPLAENRPVTTGLTELGGKMYWVYVLWSERLQKRYVGSGDNADERLREHNSGQGRFTRGGRPWMLIHKEAYSSKSEAQEREKFLKSGVGRKWLDEHFPEYRRGKK